MPRELKTKLSSSSEFLIPDPWLAELLGRPAYRLADMLPDDTQIVAQLSQGPMFVTAKVDSADVAKTASLEAAGFRVVDTALTFEALPMKKVAPAGCDQVRFAQPSDRAEVSALAGAAFRFSRFHLDPMVPKHVADRIKSCWAENFFNGRRGDGMLVAENAGRIVGFLQLLWAANGVLVIDLIAAAPDNARRGIGSAMIGFASREGTGDGRRPVSLRVGTQAANIASCRLYEGLGFRLSAATMVLHHHGTGGAYPVRAA